MKNNRGVNYRNKYFSQPKDEKNVYHKTSGIKTYNTIKKYFEYLGITRISDITGLDRLGIPVINVIRPNLSDFSISHGKGLTLQNAILSGLMESVERFHGVNISLPSITGSYNKISKSHNMIKLDNLPLSKNSLFNPDMQTEWVEGWDIINKQKVMVPIGLVSIQSTKKLEEDFKFFQSSSNGLAGGSSFLEAVLQALVEVIERDAITCHKLASKAVGSPQFPLKRINLDYISDEGSISLIKKIQKNNIDIEIFDCTIDTEVPTFNCFLIDREDPNFDFCHGMGSSLNTDVALTRAITEAVQARAVFQSGVREVIFHDKFTISKMVNHLDTLKHLDNKKIQTVSLEYKNEGQNDYALDINLCLEKCQKTGIDQVIVFDITNPVIKDLSVVKVLVPGMEGYILPYYTPGKRGLDFLNGRKGV